jgi:signal transduction histidine kinase
MIDRLEKSFAQAKQFSQDAAHEIRTPLTIVRGEIEQLLDGENVDGNTSKTLENILEEIQYLSSISERLLLIHKMDTSKIKYHFEDIDLSKLLEEVYQDVLIISSEKQLEISKQIQEGLLLKGNKELLTRMLWNFAENGIKYNKQGGSMSLTLKADKKNICIEIEDGGIGIPSEDIPKIFDRFYRVDKSRSRQLGGSGLGLSICKWIADLHNGSIEVESDENEGSLFRIYLPY